jgi:hypothetical protein
MRFAICRLYGQSGSGERPMRHGRCQAEFLDSAKPQGHLRRVPAGSPDDEKQDNQKQEDPKTRSKNKKSEETHAKIAEQG